MLTQSGAGVVVVVEYTIVLLSGLQRIQYAKTDSEVISKSKGSYGDKEKKKKDKKKTLESQPGAAKKPAGAVGLYRAGRCADLY